MLNSPFLNRILLFEVLVLTGSALAQKSPCPNVFKYRRYKNGSVYGALSVVSPDPTSVEINVELVVTVLLTDEQLGSMELDMNKDAFLYNIRNNQPLLFRVNFPSGNYLPYVTNILVNNVQICDGKVPPGKYNHTNITLSQTLATEIQQYFDLSTKRPTTSRNITTKRVSTRIRAFPHTFSTNKPTPNKISTIKTTVNPLLSIDEECGIVDKRHPQPYNWDGKDADIVDFPWAAAVYFASRGKHSFICGGTLISSQHILTAAHCTERNTPRKYIVVLGRKTLSSYLSPGGVVSEVKEIINHYDYLPNTGDGDISILVLKRPVQFTDVVRSACIWPKESSQTFLNNQIGTVASWGNTENKGEYDDLKQISVPVVSTDECRQSNTDFEDITSDRTFCAGSRNNRGPCNGNTGSGLYIKKDNRMYIRGVVSLSLMNHQNMCDLLNYIVFADVAKYSDWINENLRIS